MSKPITWASFFSADWLVSPAGLSGQYFQFELWMFTSPHIYRCPFWRPLLSPSSWMTAKVDTETSELWMGTPPKTGLADCTIVLSLITVHHSTTEMLLSVSVVMATCNKRRDVSCKSVRIPKFSVRCRSSNPSAAYLQDDW